VSKQLRETVTFYIRVYKIDCLQRGDEKRSGSYVLKEYFEVSTFVKIRMLFLWSMALHLLALSPSTEVKNVQYLLRLV
jgi:hypothetical protein